MLYPIIIVRRPYTLLTSYYSQHSVAEVELVPALPRHGAIARVIPQTFTSHYSQQCIIKPVYIHHDSDAMDENPPEMAFSEPRNVNSTSLTRLMPLNA